MEHNAIRRFIKEKGITHMQFVDKTGIAYETARAIIYGYTKIPSIKSMKMINNAYPELDPNTIYKSFMGENIRNMDDL